MSAITIYLSLLFGLICGALVNGMAIKHHRALKHHRHNNHHQKTTSIPGLTSELAFLDDEPAEVTHARLGHTTVLHCKAGNVPTPVIHWLRNGVRLTQGNRNSVLDDQAIYEISNMGRPTLDYGTTTSRLFIDCVTPEDAGEYTCVADTPFGRITRTTELVVDNDVPSDYVGDLCMMKRSEIHGGKPARMYMWTEQRLEYEGADVQLFCRADGYPKPRITWYDFHNQPIKNSDQYKLLENGDILIRQISWAENMGVYRCEAENELGIDDADVFLYPTM